MEALKRKRGNQKGGMSRLQTLCNEKDVNVCGLAEAESYLERVEKLMVDFENTQADIESLSDDLTAEEEEMERVAFETKYFNVKSYCKRVVQLKRTEAAPSSAQSPLVNLDETIRTLADNQLNLSATIGRLIDHDSTHLGDGNMIRSLTESQATLNTALTTLTNISRENSSSSSTTKLPCIHVPTFSGEYREWFTFKDLFVALVHNSASLSGSQKLQYLKSFLKGEAASMLKHINVTDANYEPAWAQLVERYNREKVVIEAHLRSIIEQPCNAQPSLSGIKRLYGTTNESISALKALGEPVDKWDSVLIYIILNKLDAESRQLWARETAEKSKPTYDDLIKFISKRQYELENIPIKKGSTNARNYMHTVVTASANCQLCKQNHDLLDCVDFLKMEINERRVWVRNQRICYNCLRPGHSVKQCKSASCKHCKRRHHVLIHEEGTSVSSTDQRAYPGSSSGTTPFSGHMAERRLENSGDSVLPTALIYAQGANGRSELCRVMLDSGSQVSLISEECVQRLGLKRNKSRQILDGVGNFRSQTTRGATTLKIKSRYNDFSIGISALIMSRLNVFVPRSKFNFNTKRYAQGLFLADPTYGKPAAIDIIMASNAVFNIIEDGQIRDENGCTVLQNSKFGWLVASHSGETSCSSNVVSCHLTISDNVDVLLRRFWDIEEPPTPQTETTDHICERHFMENFTRDVNGRYIVNLPFRDDRQPLGDSKIIAIHRFRAMERRLENDSDLRRQYNDFMDEYIRLGHMREVTEAEKRDNFGAYYLPHHSVLKPTSTTTRLRVVFDASCVTTNNISLNSQLLAGPVIQKDLVSMLMQFRNHRFGISADIAKMYRQIWMAESDTNFQRIFWRSSTDKPIKEYKLLTLTYGMTPASFLATRVLQQLATDEGQKYPRAANMIINNFYMDDFMGGCDMESEAEQLYDEVSKLLQSGGFDLRKWSSNSTRLFQIIPEGKRETSWNCTPDQEEAIKTLGLHWYPAKDVFGFKLFLEPMGKATKRILLREMARVFDPLGFIAPCLVQYKILLQLIWKEKEYIGWDDDLPVRFKREWRTIREDLPNLENCFIPRWAHNVGDMQLHGFADASKRAYGAVVYLRTVSREGIITTNLIMAKTKVAPIRQEKEESIARMELCAAYILVKLFLKIKLISQYKNLPCFGWTDSSVTYYWIRSDAERWGIFVANRVRAIQNVLPGCNWHHIRTDDNPADCLSRGMRPSKLIKYMLWWQGPRILHQEPIQFNDIFPARNELNEAFEAESRKTVLITTVAEHEEFWMKLLLKFSSWSTIKRVTAYVFRFINNSSTKLIRKGFLSSKEIMEAEEFWVRRAQIDLFHDEIKSVQNMKSIPRRSKLATLNPFLDEGGILRVGGRLRNSKSPFQQQHPVIISKDHRLAELIILELHAKFLHAGPQLLLTILRHNYWVISAKIIIRRIVHECSICQRYRGATIRQQMGDLPKARLEPGRAFLNTGIDYAGPFFILPRRTRGARSIKSYIALFVCLATRALHLELVSDLTTESFLAALKRFVSRRGLCWNIYSDNATNFSGASRELSELKNLIARSEHQEKVSSYLSSLNINWHFIPVASPNFGGAWESSVKSVKFHLRRTIGSSLLTIEEFGTLLCEIEACLNSRPLSPLSNAPDEFEILTPAHFLVNGSLLLLPQENLEDIKISRLTRWQYITRLQQEFWRKWHAEYLGELQSRNKWKNSSSNLKPDDVVLIKEDNLPPGKWLMGRVVTAHKGNDGLVRVATLRTKNYQSSN